MPFALALSAFAGSSALAQGSSSGTPPVPNQAPLPVVPTSPPLTLAAAIQIALDGNPEIASSRREVEAMEGARVQAGVFQNPTLSVEVEDVRRDTRTTTVLLSQPFELGGKRGARIEAAERAIDVARVQLETKYADIRANVTAAFFATLISQDRVRLAQASLELARTGSETAGKRVTAGKVSPVEETKAKVAEANVRLELVQARGELQTNLYQLRALTGPTAVFDAVDGNALQIPKPQTQETIEDRITNAPSMRQARLEVKRYGALSELEKAKRIPDITLNAGTMRSREVGRSQAVVGISVPLPIFDTNRGNITEALRRQDKAEEDARALELRLRADVGGARQRYVTTLAEVEALQSDILPGAQTAFDAAAKGFELGKFSYLDALDAQRTLLQARSQYLRSLYELHRSITDLDRLLGGPAAASGSPVSNP
ncbi:TolC family protein [Variovorax sp. ZS18.2.2]|uniref:TolC family protein n=1 Tax=Variovorax sp. ZS18.2.2 TaxID=2971255 RepID=UPI0021509B76|nr:TolC family protein [Variovorax sp. ZS18.2.2]MCR6478411.1 TolC family protein [Variovorax sp. ZS18.2.2]